MSASRQSRIAIFHRQIRKRTANVFPLRPVSTYAYSSTHEISRCLAAGRNERRGLLATLFSLRRGPTRSCGGHGVIRGPFRGCSALHLRAQPGGQDDSRHRHKDQYSGRERSEPRRLPESGGLHTRRKDPLRRQ